MSKTHKQKVTLKFVLAVTQLKIEAAISRNLDVFSLSGRIALFESPLFSLKGIGLGGKRSSGS